MKNLFLKIPQKQKSQNWSPNRLYFVTANTLKVLKVQQLYDTTSKGHGMFFFVLYK